MMLAHLTVVDLTYNLGAYAGALLASLGAEVIVPREPQATDKAEAAMDGHGKRVDVMDDASLLAVLERADIVFRGPEPQPETLAAAVLAARNPKLIDVTILPFDQGRDNAGRPATDLTIMARSGLMTIVGDPDRPPLKLPGRQAWALAGIQGAIAALTALNARAATGKGDRAWVSAYRSTVLANYREPLVWEWAGRVGNRTGNLLVRGKSGVRQVWTCADGYVTWSFVDNPPMMRAMVERIGEDGNAGELADLDWDAILVADMPRETLVRWEEIVATWLASKTREELTLLSNRHGMGLSAIDEASDVWSSAHLQARGLWTDAEVDGRPVRVPGPLFMEHGA